MAPAIHQLVAGFRQGDAISNEALLMRFLFRKWGLDSEIACAAQCVSPDQHDQVIGFDALRARLRPEDTAILHLSIGCEANAVFPTLPCRRVVLYHNITPARFFERIDPSAAASLAEGRRQAAALAGATDVALADSEFNARELAAMGYRDPRPLPLMIDLDRVHGQADAAYAARYDDGAANILFVGRVAPNKRHDELLRVFHDFQHYVEPHSRLVLAGSSGGTEAYRTLLLGQAYALGLKRVVFTGPLPQAQLNACYRTASVFLCMSEHEGFCAPLLEAMHHDVPVVAVAAAAVPETMAGAGILFRDRDYPLIAETLGRLVHDPALRAAVVERQRKRIAAYRARDFEAELRAALLGTARP